MNTKTLEGVRYINDSRQSFTLEYYLLEIEDLIDKNYGVEVVKKQEIRNEVLCEEKDGCYSLTRDLDTAKEVLNILIKNEVTPVSLGYVLEDMIEEMLA